MTRLPAAKRREQLLDTAAKLFAQHGYAGATTSQIARDAGVTEPIIYRHFKTKKDLFIALIDRTGDETIRLWEHELRSAPDPAERLKRLIRANPMVGAKGQGLYRVIIQALTEIEPEKHERGKAEEDERETILAAVNRHIEKLHKFLVEEVGRAQESGRVSKRFSPEVTAWALIHLGLGYGILAPLGVPGHGVDPSGVHVSDLIGELMLGERYRKGE